jgi:hypothetical protein
MVLMLALALLIAALAFCLLQYAEAKRVEAEEADREQD